MVGVQLAGGYQLLYFGHRYFAGRGHHGVEVAGRALEDEVAGGVAAPGLHEGEIGVQGVFEQVHLAVELAAFLALAYLRAVAGRRVEGRDARAAGPAPLGQRALRNQLHFQLAGQQLALKLGVFAHVAGNHLTYLPGLKQQPDAKIIDAGVVADAGQVLRAPAQDFLDGVLGNAAEAEAAEHERHAVGEALQGRLGAAYCFVDHRGGWNLDWQGSISRRGAQKDSRRPAKLF